jgi:DNA-binding response OmpR family regulator
MGAARTVSRRPQRRLHPYPEFVTTRATGGSLLLVEDDDSIGRLVKQYLEQQDGWRVVWRRSGEDALTELRDQSVRVVVLDIGLPGIDGFEVCRRIRAGSKVPIVMLTARDEEPDRVAGLELGADDYVSKPFSPRELSARIKAILRRSESRTEDVVLTAREVVLRRDSHEVTVAGEQVELTSTEFDLLACFLEHPGIVLSRERLLDLVWGMTYPGGTRTVDVHVAQLRRKLGDPDGIRTVRGSGYKLVPA